MEGGPASRRRAARERAKALLSTDRVLRLLRGGGADLAEAYTVATDGGGAGGVGAAGEGGVLALGLGTLRRRTHRSR